MEDRFGKNGREKLKKKPITLNPVKVAGRLLQVLLALTVGNLMVVYARAIQDSKHWFQEGTYLSKIESAIVGFLDFNGEGNFPTFYSSLLLVFSALILMVIYVQYKRSGMAKKARSWQLLSFLFLFLALDESVEIHEMTMGPTRTVLPAQIAELLPYAWVVPYSIVGVITIFYFIPFLFKIPVNTRNLFILSGLLFVAGGMGMEVIGGYFSKAYSTESIYYRLSYSIEEFLEMSGVILFIYSLLDYVSRQKMKFKFVSKIRTSNKKLHDKGANPGASAI